MRPAVSALLVVCLLDSAGLAGKDKKGPEDIGNSNPGKGVNFYSIEKEIALGKQMAEEVERQSMLINDDVIAEYVSRLGQNLVRNSDANVPFTIKVIDSEEVNAFALPGGFMFVNTGLILRAEGEAELAGVMSHEIAHVAARHGTRQATRSVIVNYATIPLIFIGGWTGYAIRQAASLAVPLGFLQFSRSMELEADHLGLEYLYKAGYDPTAFVDFFEKIQSVAKNKPGIISKLFSTHPMTGSRITHAQKEIQNELKPLPRYVVDTSEFQLVRDRLMNLANRRKGEFAHDRVLILKRRDTPAKNSPSDNSGPRDDDRPTLKRKDYRQPFIARTRRYRCTNCALIRSCLALCSTEPSRM